MNCIMDTAATRAVLPTANTWSGIPIRTFRREKMMGSPDCMTTRTIVMKRYTVRYFHFFINLPKAKIARTETFTNLWIVSLILMGLSITSIFFLWLIPNARMNERILIDGDDTSATAGSLVERWFKGKKTGDTKSEVSYEVSSEKPLDPPSDKEDKNNTEPIR
mmetsp:Transcript_8918/g.7460  ORF Transcript_8918/g.7460 Transcript_8918/m.7460 type:complete len:163 (+) Transcript_8918:47-535(+)